MKKFEITNDIEEFEIKGQKYSEKYTVYRLKDISEVNRKFWLERGCVDKNDIIMVAKWAKS